MCTVIKAPCNVNGIGVSDIGHNSIQTGMLSEKLM